MTHANALRDAHETALKDLGQHSTDARQRARLMVRAYLTIVGRYEGVQAAAELAYRLGDEMATGTEQ